MESIISIIIPVYQAERYLRRCIDSVIEQKHQNYEILLIDDGSTDGSSAICDEYANKYVEIQVIHKKNEGVSVTRNMAMKLCRGKYIMFVDADDYILPGTLSKLDNIIQKKEYDIIMYNFVDEANKDKSNEIIFETNDIKIEDVYQKIIDTGYFNPACTRLISRKFIEDNNLEFPTDYIIGEDMIFNLNVYSNKPTFYYLPEALYYYRKNDTSIMNTKNEEKLIKKIDDTIRGYYLYFDYLKKWNLDNPENRNKIAYKFITMLHLHLKEIARGKLPRKEKMKILSTYFANDKLNKVRKETRNLKRFNISEKSIIYNKCKKYYEIERLKGFLKRIKDTVRKV